MLLATKPKHVVDNLLRLHSYALGTKEEQKFHFDRLYNAEHQVYYNMAEGTVFAPVKWCGARDNSIADYDIKKGPVTQVFQRALEKVGYRQLTEGRNGYDEIYREFLTFCGGFGFKHSGANVPHSDSRPRTFWALEFSRGRKQSFPDEVDDEGNFSEGAVKQVLVNAYERSTAARLACIAHYGWNCQACDLNFEKQYGELGAEFIHVHHLRPVSQLQESYKVDPVADLRPVCPNCHAMIHRQDPPLSISSLRMLLTRT